MEHRDGRVPGSTSRYAIFRLVHYEAFRSIRTAIAREKEIKGWRRDKETVAAFTFEERKNSYAYLRGYRDNIGVIGLIAIEEQIYLPRPLTEFYRGATALPKSIQSFAPPLVPWYR